MTDKDKIIELERKLSVYENNPVAELYAEVAFAMKHLQMHIRAGTLDLEKNIYQMSLFAFAKDADKMFNSMEKGKKIFEIDAEDKVSRKGMKSTTIALGS